MAAIPIKPQFSGPPLLGFSDPLVLGGSVHGSPGPMFIVF